MDQRMLKTTSGLLKIFGWSLKFGIGPSRMPKSRPVFEGSVVMKVAAKSRRKLQNTNAALLVRRYASSLLQAGVVCSSCPH